MDNKKKFDWYIVKRILDYAKPYRFVLYATIILTVLLSFIALVRPILIAYTVDEHIIAHFDFEKLGLFCLLMLGALIVETILQYYLSYYSGLLGQSVVKDLRLELYNHMVKFKLKYFDHTPIGTVVTRIVNDIETVSDIFSEGLLSILGDLLKLFVVLGYMFYVDWQLTLISIIPVPLLIISTNIFKNGIAKTFSQVRTEVANMNAFTQEHITGMSIVQAYNREEIELTRFKEINKNHRKAHIKSVWYYSIFLPVVEILSALSIALLVWWGARQMMLSDHHTMTTGTIIKFILLIYMLYRPMRQLADRFNSLQMGIISSERVFKIIDTEEKLEDVGTISSESITGDIELKNVYFHYVENEPILKNFNLKINQGEKVAIVGATGSGKTTLTSLISRMYEIQSGEILIDGIRIKDFKLDELQKSIGIVLQDVFLFSDSIYNNVTLNNSAISRDEVIRAAKEVGAYDFIMKLPNNFDYKVGERGAQLSVGQRQLISFIRAYVYNPKILILDEATSSIDSETESLIQEATEKITQGRTAIMIAHRLSTVVNADRIIVMEKGEIVEMGNHTELLQKNGVYKNLYELQFSKK